MRYTVLLLSLLTLTSCAELAKIKAFDLTETLHFNISEKTDESQSQAKEG
jgi:hypothetical protein